MQLYLLCFITFYFQFGIYKGIRTQHTTLMKRKSLYSMARPDQRWLEVTIHPSSK